MARRIVLNEVAPNATKGLYATRAYLAQCGLALALVELVYLRVSQINGCAYCIDKHAHDLLKQGMALDKLLLVPVWREAGDLFDARERAALQWAESLTCVAQTQAPDADYAAAAALFTPRELGDLTLAISVMNALNRLGVGLRLVPGAVAKAAQAVGAVAA